jgi:hypothetical protein
MGIDKNNPKELIAKNRFLETGVEWLDTLPSFTFRKGDCKSLKTIYRNVI